MKRFLGVGVLVCALCFAGSANADNRTSTSKKGSLLVFPNIELKWDAAGNLTQNTFISVTNDFSGDVFVHFKFVNGDDPLDAVTMGNPPITVERTHAGWNFFNWTSLWTGHASHYFNVLNGQPKGAPAFTGLDPTGIGGPGRPDAEGSGRVLRGFLLAWAVDANGYQISHNHLTGLATIVHYGQQAAWEYAPYAFQAIVTSEGTRVGSEAGNLYLDGSDYDYPFNRLILDFYGSGASPFNRGATNVQVNTDLSILPLKIDVRQDNIGPIRTKLHMEIWNSNEDFISNTTRCIACWDQFLLSSVSDPNGFLMSQLQSDKGKAHIDGQASDVCDENFCCDRWDSECIADYAFEVGGDAPICSEDAPLAGVANKILGFSGAATGTALAGSSLPGSGEEEGKIKSDLPSDDEQAQDGTDGRLPETANPVRSSDLKRDGVRGTIR